MSDNRAADIAAGASQGEISRAVEADVDELSVVLARAFFDDPVNVWLFPDPARRERFLAAFYELLLRRIHLKRGEVYTLSNHGAALWDPPGEWRVGLFEMVRSGAPLVAAMGTRIIRGMRALSFVERKHPRAPHFYLAVLGTDPERQNLGIGSRLLTDMLSRCDAEGLPAYLESSSENSKRLYERHGFEVVEMVHLPPDGPPIWLMWRDPQG